MVSCPHKTTFQRVIIIAVKIKCNATINFMLMGMMMFKGFSCGEEMRIRDSLHLRHQTQVT